MFKLFSLENQPINLTKEIIGGCINFMAIAYIIGVNPMILYAGGKGFALNPSITATILAILIATSIAGLLIKLPFVIAPGMGLNALVSYTLIVNNKLSPEIALGVVFWSSILLFIFSVTPLRQKIITAIPQVIQISLTVGIGFFLVFLGIKNIGLVVSNPSTLLTLNKFNSSIALSLLGLLISTTLFIRKKPYAFILPVIIITILSQIFNHNQLPTQIVALPDFSLFLNLNLIDSFKLSLLPTIISLFVVNFFDATSTVVGLLSQVKYDSPQQKTTYCKRALIADSLGGMVSSVVGTSPGVIFVESSAAIQNGARTGIASMVTAVLCIPFLFLAPLISLIPVSATSPILILVGILMMENLRKLKLDHLEDLVAVVLTIIMMPLCFSITSGAVFGLLSYTLLKISLGKWEQLSPSLIIIALGAAAWLISN